MLKWLRKRGVSLFVRGDKKDREDLILQKSLGRVLIVPSCCVGGEAEDLRRICLMTVGCTGILGRDRS